MTPTGSHRTIAEFRRRAVRHGTVHIIEAFYAPELGNTRELHVYLPAEYEAGERRYPVVYLQDGQNLFDPSRAFAEPWGADAAADAVARLGYEAIIVGIANVGTERIDEYSPFVDARVGGGRGELYLAFVVRRVKRFIDRAFRTLPEREHTVIGGASMGGLISLYAFFRYPEVFGRVAAQSAALWFAGGALLDYVDAVPFIPGRIFLDVGQREGRHTLQNARSLRERLIGKGYVEGTTLRWIEAEAGTHSEDAWGRRLKRALPFLLRAGARVSTRVPGHHHVWHARQLGRDMHVRWFGHGGARVLAFPTSMGDHNEWPNRFMPDVLREHIANGWITLFCLDHNHDASWYNKRIAPRERARRQLAYDTYLRDELLPFTRSVNDNPFVIATGASFGAYHAMLFGLRNPSLVHRIVGMSGMYDIGGMADHAQDELVYACNPPAFIPNEWQDDRLHELRRQDIIMAIGRDDPSFADNEAFSGALWRKGIGNALRVWDGHAHDWPWWERMIAMYIGGHD